MGIYCATGLSWPGFTRKIRLKLEENVYFVFWVSQRTECALDIKSWALVALTTVRWSPRTSTPHQTQSRMAQASSAHSRYHNSSVKSVGQKKVMEFPASTFKIKLYKPIAFYTSEPASWEKGDLNREYMTFTWFATYHSLSWQIISYLQTNVFGVCMITCLYFTHLLNKNILKHELICSAIGSTSFLCASQFRAQLVSFFFWNAFILTKI